MNKVVHDKQFKKGNVPWNKGLKGVQVSWNKGMSYHPSEQHNRWKGENVGYIALHQWVRRRWGIPLFCSIDLRHKAKRYVWANISGDYKRDLGDWRSLCNSCNLRDGVSAKKHFIDRKARRQNYA